ncbi:MAG: galactose-1-phosphate uridylyltransferase [Fusobacteria bacterium]|nr:galactose-1-phosphate uridylyltransferase [Fusobacteriota bacterium]
MSELRKDPVSKRWVIFSEERGNRPNQYDKENEEEHNSTEDISKCPFCEGKEKKSGDEILAYEKIHNREPNSPGWWVRVLENKFPALTSKGATLKKGVGIYDKMSGNGRHEIIVETPKHYDNLPDLGENEIEKVIYAYRDRYTDIAKDNNIKYILIFKNFGRDAGASLEHSHSQLIATPVIPKKVETELHGAKDYYRFRDRCVFCDIITQELADNERIIEENELFISFVYYAGRFPYEIWILPKQHSAKFELINKKEVKDLASILKNTLQRVKKLLGNPHYNFVIHTLPIKENDTFYFHWHIEIMPKLTKVAGFEWGTGFYINPVLPEVGAKYLRECKID